MSGDHTSSYVHVQDGRESKLDLWVGNSTAREGDRSEVDPDLELAAELREQWAADKAKQMPQRASLAGKIL